MIDSTGTVYDSSALSNAINDYLLKAQGTSSADYAFNTATKIDYSWANKLIIPNVLRNSSIQDIPEVSDEAFFDFTDLTKKDLIGWNIIDCRDNRLNLDFFFTFKTRPSAWIEEFGIVFEGMEDVITLYTDGLMLSDDLKDQLFEVLDVILEKAKSSRLTMREEDWMKEYGDTPYVDNTKTWTVHHLDPTYLPSPNITCKVNYATTDLSSSALCNSTGSSRITCKS